VNKPPSRNMNPYYTPIKAPMP